jgi:hypothetical protein
MVKENLLSQSAWRRNQEDAKMANQTLTRHDLGARIVQRCRQDEEFRREFIGSPADAVARYLETPASSLPKIMAHEELAGSWHIVLPQKPMNPSELSERDLESIAGGNTPTFAAIAAVTAVSGLGAATISASVIATLDNGW